MQIQISWLLQKPTDGFFRSQLIWIYSLQRQNISGFSRTRVKTTLSIPMSTNNICLHGEIRNLSILFDEKEKKKQEDHDGPISLTWPNRFVHLLLEVSAKFTALGFFYKLYSTNHPHPPPPHPRPCFFTNLDDLNWILKEGHQRNISAKLYWNWSSGLKSFI